MTAPFPHRYLLPEHSGRLRAGYLLALLVAVISIGDLLLPSAYARETPNWRAQAIAQDWFDLLFASPALVVATSYAVRGSRRAQAMLAGLGLYAVYTLAIYCFAVHLNALFLLYCATFGIALFATGALGMRLLGERSDWFVGQPRRLTGGFLIAVGLLFGALWLSQLVPAAIHGTQPTEMTDTGLFTNPVHVLDLSFILPLHVITGFAVLRRRAYAPALAGGLLGFGAAMAMSISFLALMTESWPVAIAMAIIALLSATLASLVTRTTI
jgi:hypothetical protein